MEKAGINPEVFKKIIISADYYKKEQYSLLLHEFRCKPSQALVCGDKFDTDLLPAKELNMKTVQIMFGRARKVPRGIIEPDYTIYKLEELLPLIEKLKP